MARTSFSGFLESTSNVLAKIMNINSDEQGALQTLQTRLKTILPEEYQDRYEEMEPVSMGSAALKYGSDGRVAWGDIWDTFCDLAMAGGPPHKGMLLEPGAVAEIQESPERQQTVVEEISRGIRLASDITVVGPVGPGWVRLNCVDPTMAEWMLRAVTMENISCRWQDASVDVPAGPQYRVEKEIKNVITTIAKTSHYWDGHIWRKQKEEIRRCFDKMESESRLIQPALRGLSYDLGEHDAVCSMMAREIHAATGLSASSRRYFGWFGVECANVHAAVWMMRLLTAMNVLARREHTVLFVPINPLSDPQGQVVASSLGRVHQYAHLQSVI